MDLALRIDTHHHFHFHSAGEESFLAEINRKVDRLMATIQELKDEVARDTDIDSSAVTLIQGLIAQVEANKTDPIALDGVLATMKANADALAAAVAANTQPQPGNPPGAGTAFP